MKARKQGNGAPTRLLNDADDLSAVFPGTLEDGIGDLHNDCLPNDEYFLVPLNNQRMPGEGWVEKDAFARGALRMRKGGKPVIGSRLGPFGPLNACVRSP
jgi:hypothetical protein